ncbi:hypothetical protein [Pararhodobacter sp.]|uniref:hypothetical protein n=1 Tax=Pararhodobacter sp. TaxID=2127056 RepID=UPI002AFE607C|nr:hypothetical protein [Pararhodobacter sp.]
MRIAILATALAVAITPAMADETWITDRGTLVWQDTLGDTAVLEMNTDAGLRLVAYVPGLGRDMLGGRSTYHGYWLANQGDAACEAQLTGPDGEKSHYWGTFTMSFVRDGFPSDWAGTSGSCFDPQETTISGQVPG